jgi:signal transduction histidine kinase
VPFRGEYEHYRRLKVVTDAALAHLDLDELLAELLMRIRDVLAVDTAAILLLDDASSELVARAAVGIEGQLEQRVRIPLGKGFAGRVAAERAAIVLDDVDHADVVNPLLRKMGIKTLLGVPLLVAGKSIGVLHVGAFKTREFEASDVDLLQLVADRAAIAIEHAKLFEAERRARLQLENVQAVTDVALAHLELDDLLAELLARICHILRVDTSTVLLLDADENDLVARAAVGIEEEVEQGVRIPVGKGFAGRVAAGGAPVILEDVARAEVLNPLLQRKGIKSLLGVPLTVRDKVIGVLHVGTLAPRAFDNEDVHLLQLVAERVALAIEKARLHDDVVRLDQLKLNFVAVASHELRAPATAVYGALATLRERGDALSPEIQRQLSETAWEQSDRLRRIIEQLLDLSRLDARSIKIEPRTVSLQRVLEDVVKATNPLSSDVTLDVDSELAVVADPLVIDRVVTNLVANARSYGRPPIHIAASQTDGELTIVVEDCGGGISDDLAARLFGRFERGNEGHGSGLGLAIAKAYANAHGGDLVYSSVGTGARFELTLPRG